MKRKDSEVLKAIEAFERNNFEIDSLLEHIIDKARHEISRFSENLSLNKDIDFMNSSTQEELNTIILSKLPSFIKI